MHREWATPGRMFRLLGRVGEVVIQWRAVDADAERHFRFGNGGRAELRCVFRDWPVLPPVALFVPAHVSDATFEMEVDAHVRVTFSSGETIRVPIPEPSQKRRPLRR